MGTILVGDDDPDDRLLVEEALGNCTPCYALRFAEDGVELMDYLRHKGAFADVARSPLPGLILLDLNMPRMSGREALRAIKSDAQLRSIPVIIWTTSHAEEDIEASYRDGADRFVTKPTTFVELQHVLCALAHTWLSGHASVCARSAGIEDVGTFTLPPTG